MPTRAENDPEQPARQLPQVNVATSADLRAWLSANHGQSSSIWLVTGKKAAGKSYMPYDAIVEVALCFGWVDSLPRSLDATRSMRLLSPRKPGSAWSKVNNARIERLVAEGLVEPAGLAAVERTKADGSWFRLDAVETLDMPDDLAAALAAHPLAASRFAAFPRSSKRLILEWISTAKKPETRAARILETARLAAENRRAHHHRKPERNGSMTKG